MFKSSSLSNYAPLQNPTFTGKVTLPDGSTITKSTSSYLKQTDAVNTYATKSSVTSVENTLYDTIDNLNNTYATKENPTFTGTVTFPDNSTITNYLKSATASSTYLTQSSASSTYLSKATAEEDYLQISTALGNFLSTNTAAETYAPKANPTFTGTVTFNTEGTTITDYLKTSTAASTYATKNNSFFTGILTFPDGSVPEDYLLQTTANSNYLNKTDAASTYLTQTNAAATYAPKASPTFTGNIVLNGNVTLAETSANSLTLNDNLSLCTGTNYATPNVNNMLGYGFTATIVTDTLISSPNITTNTLFVYSSINLTYGVWLLYGTAGFQVTTAGTITSVQVSIGSSNTAISGNFGVTDQSTQTVRDATYISHNVMRIMSVSAASVPHYLLGKYTFTGCTLNSRQGYSSFYAYRIA